MDMRKVMPVTAGFIEELRDAFGAEAVNPSMRRGIAGEPGWFHAVENGHEVGTAWPDGPEPVVPVIPQSVLDEINGQARTAKRAKRRE